MSHAIEVATDSVRLPLPRASITAIARSVLRAERVRDAHLSITFVSVRRIASLNRQHLGHRGSTDVISFVLASDVAGSPIIGDIYIAPEIARRNAATHGVSEKEEVTRLVVHGVLHVLGFDHPAGRGRTASPMWQRQEALLRTLQRRSGARGGRPRRRARSAA
jgi:probable rRNA maturation factor